MITVEITQFIAPHGEQRERFAEVPDDCAVRAAYPLTQIGRMVMPNEFAAP